MNVYDFDGTIYKKDSSIELYKFVIKMKPIIFVKCFLRQFFAIIKYKLKLISKENMKEKYFCFLNYIEIDNILDDFVEREIKNINEWYFIKQRVDDVIISASPSFLIERFCKRLGINHVIATEVDIATGKFRTNNCYGEEKVKRFKEKFNFNEIEEFYSDSKSDLPMAKLAETSYYVKNKKLILWNP